jgi:hypothetical protein
VKIKVSGHVLVEQELQHNQVCPSFLSYLNCFFAGNVSPICYYLIQEKCNNLCQKADIKCITVEENKMKLVLTACFYGIKTLGISLYLVGVASDRKVNVAHYAYTFREVPKYAPVVVTWTLLFCVIETSSNLTNGEVKVNYKGLFDLLGIAVIASYSQYAPSFQLSKPNAVVTCYNGFNISPTIVINGTDILVYGTMPPYGIQVVKELLVATVLVIYNGVPVVCICVYGVGGQPNQLLYVSFSIVATE